MSLNVSDVSVARGGVKLLGGVSFTLESGEALVLRGPNGVGKTTLLRTIAGLQPPLSGTVLAPDDSIVYAGHADGLKAMLSVAENLQFWAQIHGHSDVSSALSAFDLAGFQNRLAGTLSAGQKRRLGLARLMVSKRPIWIMDEPTVSLDAEAVGLFARAVERHLADGGSALMATHIDLGVGGARDLDLAQFHAKSIAVDEFDEAFL